MTEDERHQDITEKHMASCVRVSAFMVELYGLEQRHNLTNSEYVGALGEAIYRRMDSNRMAQLRGLLPQEHGCAE